MAINPDLLRAALGGNMLPKNPAMSPGGPPPGPSPVDWNALMSNPYLTPYSDPQLEGMANQRAWAQIAALGAPISRAQQAAQRRALGEQNAMTGATNAVIPLLNNIGPSMSGGYAQAQQALADAGGQVSSSAAPFSQFAGQQIGGEGAAQQGWAAQLGQIQGNEGQQLLAGLINKAEGEQADYSQQLIDLAAQEPAMHDQIIDALHQHELDKLNARLGIAQNQEQAYNAERDYQLNVRQLDQQQKQADRSYGLDKANLALNRAQFGEGRREFGLTHGENVREFNASQAQNARQFNANLRNTQHEFGINTDLARTQEAHSFELGKGNLALSKTTEAAREKEAAWQHAIDLTDVGIRKRAETLAEKQFGHQVNVDTFQQDLEKAKLAFDKSQLVLRNKQAKMEAAIAIAKITDEGKQLSPENSRTTGVLTDNNGDPILDSNGNTIKVDPRLYGGGGKGGKGGKPPVSQTVSYQVSHAVSEARTIRGNPIEYTGPSHTPDVRGGPPGGRLIKGKYIAADNAKGVYTVPDGNGGFIRTTNDPTKAKYDTTLTFARALAYLHNKYPKVPMPRLRAALVNMGWKPDGKRPAKAPPVPPVPTGPGTTFP